jgi:hypothetical protein
MRRLHVARKGPPSVALFIGTPAALSGPFYWNAGRPQWPFLLDTARPTRANAMQSMDMPPGIC